MREVGGAENAEHILMSCKAYNGERQVLKNKLIEMGWDGQWIECPFGLYGVGPVLEKSQLERVMEGALSLLKAKAYKK